MARQTGNKGSGSGSGGGKIRLLWIDADLGGTDDVAQVTQAIVAALRPPTIQHQPRLIAPSTTPMNGHTGNGAEDLVIHDLEEVSDTVDDVHRAPKASRTSKSRKARDPNIVDGLDLNGNGVSFVDFAKGKNTTNHSKRFLTILAWFKNHGGKPTIGTDEVYTVYRSAGLNWPYNIDYSKVLRNLAQRDLVKGDGNGQYAINVAGEAALENDTE